MLGKIKRFVMQPFSWLVTGLVILAVPLGLGFSLGIGENIGWILVSVGGTWLLLQKVGFLKK